MKTKDVQIGTVYIVKVSGKLAKVRLDAVSPYGGWIGRNIETKREVRIKTAAKLRREVTVKTPAAANTPQAKQPDTAPTIDFSVQNEGSIFLLRPLTPAAKEWVSEHIPDDAQYFGNAVVIEHRYISDIVAGIQGDGLAVS